MTPEQQAFIGRMLDEVHKPVRDVFWIVEQVPALCDMIEAQQAAYDKHVWAIMEQQKELDRIIAEQQNKLDAQAAEITNLRRAVVDLADYVSRMEPYGRDEWLASAPFKLLDKHATIIAKCREELQSAGRR